MNTMTQKPGRNALCPCGGKKKYKVCCAAAPTAPIAGRDVKGSLIVLQPTRGMISVETHQCLVSSMDGIPATVAQLARLPVDQARNKLAKSALEIAATQDGFKDAFVLWVDDDAWWQPGTIAAMMATLDQLGELDILSAWCSKREAFSPPVVMHRDNALTVKYGEIVEADFVGAHFLMHRVELLRHTGDEPFSKIDAAVRMGEDMSFCERVRSVGGKIFAKFSNETTVLHVNTQTGLAYGPNMPALRITRNGAVPVSPEDLEGLARGSDGFDGIEVDANSTLIKEANAVRSYGPMVDEVLDMPASAGRDSPVVIFTAAQQGSVAPRTIEVDLDGLTRDGAYTKLMSTIRSRCLLTMIPSVQLQAQVGKLADLVGTSRNGGPTRVIVSAHPRSA